MRDYVRTMAKYLKDYCAMATNDMDHAEKTYGSFISSLKWAVPLICVITLFVIALIAE